MHHAILWLASLPMDYGQVPCTSIEVGEAPRSGCVRSNVDAQRGGPGPPSQFSLMHSKDSTRH